MSLLEQVKSHPTLREVLSVWGGGGVLLYGFLDRLPASVHISWTTLAIVISGYVIWRDKHLSPAALLLPSFVLVAQIALTTRTWILPAAGFIVPTAALLWSAWRVDWTSVGKKSLAIGLLMCGLALIVFGISLVIPAVQVAQGVLYVAVALAIVGLISLGVAYYHADTGYNPFGGQ